jgi:predicted P-loop ATPase
MDGREIVESYISRGLKLVFWPGDNDWKGPRTKHWLKEAVEGRYTIDDYHDGDRVGILHGVEISPRRYVVDVDIDWSPGAKIAMAMLPKTQFIWGRASKKYSHCLYTCPDIVPEKIFKDVGTEKGKDGITLIEFRSDTHQSMAPPSEWEKNGHREPLIFVHDKELTFVDGAEKLKQRVTLGAIGMLLALNLGKNGFGHDARLAWAGFLMRFGISDEDLITMGLVISEYCSNLEVGDVRTVVESTRKALSQGDKKVKGGPALAEVLGGERGKWIVERINEWMGRERDFVRTRSGAIIPKNQENIRLAVERLGHTFSYDEFAAKPLMDNGPLDDRQWKTLADDIEREFRFIPPEKEYFTRVIEVTAWKNSFHPVKDYLNQLQWDHVPRVDTWLIHSGGVEDNQYTRAVSSIMLIAAVRRIRQPGCKYDEMVVWESPLQGTDKSSAAQALCPNPAWFSDDLRLNLHSKELIESTLGKWIIEASDLAGKRKTEIEQLKAMLSRQVDGPARMAWGHFPIERPRHFILIGTTNSSIYLTDPTGARRFWPLAITRRFDIAWIRRCRDQLWAEASVREANGEPIRLSEELWPEASQEQEKRREIDPWEDIIRRLLLTPNDTTIILGGDDRLRVTAEALWQALGIPVERQDRTASLRVTDVMQRLGFKRTRVRPKGGDVQIGFKQESIDALEGYGDDMSYGRSPGSDDE